MIRFMIGASHTGKTTLAQKLLEKYHDRYRSIDHLKMGLIRNGTTELTPMGDDSVGTPINHKKAPHMRRFFFWFSPESPEQHP